MQLQEPESMMNNFFLLKMSVSSQVLIKAMEDFFLTVVKRDMILSKARIARDVASLHFLCSRNTCGYKAK